MKFLRIGCLNKNLPQRANAEGVKISGSPLRGHRTLDTAIIPLLGGLVKVYPFGGENNEKEDKHSVLGREGKALVHCGAEERHPQTVLQQHAGQMCIRDRSKP